MIFISWLLTLLLILNCGVLMLLVLVQLPKKDAGAGLAFGGGAADALFGAGSGNALTKITKWAILLFVILAVALGSTEIKMHSGGANAFEQGVESQQQLQSTPQVQQPGTAQPETSSGMPATTPAATPPSSSPAMPLLSATNALPSTATPNGK
jgi:protein translocase SecG subunit